MTHRPVFLLVLAELAFPAFVLADTVTSGTLTVTGSISHKGSSNTINMYDCTGLDPDGKENIDYITVAWTGATQFVSGDSMRIDVSNTQNCPTTGTNVYTATLIDSFTGNGAADQWARSGDTANKIKASDLVAKVPSGAGFSCSMSSSTTIYVCVVDITQSNLTLGGSVILNTAAPAAPTGVTAEPGNQRLYASWTAVSGTSITYMVRAAPTADPTAYHDSTQRFTGTTGDVGGLTNGVTYNLVVFAFNIADNRSPASNTVTETPIQTDDYWDRYHQAGGVEEGGCNSGSAGALAPLLLLFPLRRRRRP